MTLTFASSNHPTNIYHTIFKNYCSLLLKIDLAFYTHMTLTSDKERTGIILLSREIKTCLLWNLLLKKILVEASLLVN